MYTAKLGMDLARNIMAHKGGGTVLEQYYLRSATSTVNLVGVRLGEVRGKNEPVAGEGDQEALTLFKSAALQCLMRKRTAMENNNDQAETTAGTSKRQRNEHDEHPDILQIDKEIEPRWRAYLACFNWTGTRRTALKMAQQNVNSLYNGKYDTMSRKSGKDDEIQGLYNDLCRLFSDRSDVKRKVSKNSKRQKLRDERAVTFKTAEWADHDEAQARLDLLAAMGSIDRAAAAFALGGQVSSGGPASSNKNSDLQNELCDKEWTADSSTDTLAAGGSESTPKRWIDVVIDVQRAVSAEDELDAQAPPKIMSLLKGHKPDTDSALNTDQPGASGDAASMEEGQAQLADDIANMADADEELEFDVFGCLSLEDVKRQMLTYFLGPCLLDGTLVSIRDGKMDCELCTARGNEFSGNNTEMRRHKDYCHSEWAELKETLGGEDEFHCPSCPEEIHEDRRVVIAHMLSEDCPEEGRYTEMFKKHKADTAKWHLQSALPVLKETRGLKNRAEDLKMERMIAKVTKLSITPRHDNDEAASALGVDPIEHKNKYRTFNYDNILQLGGVSFPRMGFKPGFTTGQFTDNDCDNVYMIDDL